MDEQKPLHMTIALSLAVSTLTTVLNRQTPVLARAWAQALRAAGTRAPEFVGPGVQECLSLWVGCLTKPPIPADTPRRP